MNRLDAVVVCDGVERYYGYVAYLSDNKRFAVISWREGIGTAMMGTYDVKTKKFTAKEHKHLDLGRLVVA
jgi:hypothetical protein